MRYVGTVLRLRQNNAYAHVHNNRMKFTNYRICNCTTVLDCVDETPGGMWTVRSGQEGALSLRPTASFKRYYMKGVFTESSKE